MESKIKQILIQNEYQVTSPESHLSSIELSGSRADLCHVRRFGDVLFITEDMDCVLARDGGPVRDVSGAIAVVFAVDLGLGWALDGETCSETEHIS